MSSFPFETEHGIFSQPRPPGNNHNITTAINNNNLGGGGAVEVFKLIRQDLIYMKKAVAEVNKYMDGLNVKINQASEKFRELQTINSGSEIELRQLRKTIAKLKCRIPSNLDMRSTEYSNPIQNPWSDTFIDNSSSSSIRDDHVNNASEDSFIDFEKLFLDLDWKHQVRLSCFLKFPKNAIIKKRLIVYWWIGAGLLVFNSNNRKFDEQLANDFFDELVERGLIEPVYEKRGLVADSCRIHPLLYSILTKYAPNEEIGWLSGLRKNCYYLSDHRPNFGSATLYDGPELLSNMERNARIFYLGRWQSSGSHHIEVANMNFFDVLKNMGKLRFLSLRGISLITELPQYILKQTKLVILDLRACYNLETLPDRIDLLKNLTHLDTSECYFLEQMPKTLATLQNLQVLKGFVIGDSTSNTSCSLGDLARLSKLRKLNIYYRGVKNFPANEQLGELQTLHALRKLTISWGGNFSETQSLESDNSQVVLSLALHKLDLRGFPGINVPNWLRPAKLNNLKKLYIRGGRLRDLRQFQSNEKIGVEILRFRYMSELDLDWGDLRKLFPSLKYLEIKECPNLTGFQCDENGVWMNKTEN